MKHDPWISLEEQKIIKSTLTESVKDQKQPQVVEVGIGRAGTSLLIVKHLKLLGVTDYFFHGFELKARGIINWNDVVSNRRGTIHEGYSWRRGRELADKSICWCFIDGSHVREDVMKDIDTFAPRVAKNGFLLFHDTGIKRNLLCEFGIGLSGNPVNKRKFGALRAVLDRARDLYDLGFKIYQICDYQDADFEKRENGMIVFRRTSV
jgi:hypothetical protein